MRDKTFLVKPKNVLKTSLKVAGVIARVSEDLEKVDIEKLKTDPNTIEYIGQLLASEFGKKFDIKSTLIQIIKKVTPLTQQEIEAIERIYDYLETEGKIVGPSVKKQAWNWAKNFLGKK